MYHSALPSEETDPAIVRGQVHIHALDHHLRWLRRYARVIPLSEAVAYLRSNERPPPRTTVLTFDDGLWNNAALCYPLLERYELPATFFVATDHIESDRMLWFNRLIAEAVIGSTDIATSTALARTLRDRFEADPAVEPARAVSKQLGLSLPEVSITDRLRAALGGMTRDQLHTIARSGLVDVGAHTVTHPRLTRCAPGEIEHEITASRDFIEQVTGVRVRFFAYPEGKFDDAVVEAVRRAGYEAAVGVEAVPGAGQDLYRIPRLVINRNPISLLAAKWAGLVGPIRALRRSLGLQIPSALTS